MDIAALNGCDFRRRLRFADRLSERAMALGLSLANTPRARSSASLFCPTAADHFRGEGFAGPPDFALAISPTPTCLYPAVGLAGRSVRPNLWGAKGGREPIALFPRAMTMDVAAQGARPCSIWPFVPDRNHDQRDRGLP